ncbi:hypothetical protein A0J61_10908 [Choanephora cucurbitarum]|uniref:Uncharacterized protein n=1 Tax=Choanephora cucurbitarum TaxID=101091 RepID=A0A1C7N110_9FUNG|nr:hypothetical protein A0J61_10908 [Choanephora cucurbitarum]
MYIAAVVDLYNEQTLAGPHSHCPHPRGKLVEALCVFLNANNKSIVWKTISIMVLVPLLMAILPLLK